MLSLNSGIPIAIILPKGEKTPKKGETQKYLYYKDASKEEPAEIETSKEQKIKIFKSMLDRNDKLRTQEKKEIILAYANDEDLENKTLQKVLEKGSDYVDKSLKRYLQFDSDSHLMPWIEEKSFRVYCTGTTGSGKTYFISQLLSINKPRGKGGIFMFSPFEDDESIKIKNLIRIKLETYEDEYEKPFELEDIPDGSICIFDDIDTYKEKYRNLYYEVRDTLMERGRHPAQGGKWGISTVNIVHNPLQGAKSKVSIRESMYYACFPKHNPRDCKTLLKTYTSISKDCLDEIMNTNSRWIWVRKSVPTHFIGEHEIGLLH